MSDSKPSLEDVTCPFGTFEGRKISSIPLHEIQWFAGWGNRKNFPLCVFTENQESLWIKEVSKVLDDEKSRKYLSTNCGGFVSDLENHRNDKDMDQCLSLLNEYVGILPIYIFCDVKWLRERVAFPEFFKSAREYFTKMAICVKCGFKLDENEEVNEVTNEESLGANLKPNEFHLNCWKDLNTRNLFLK